MAVDPKYLREHYGSLSDEGLLEMERGDLVEVAQQIYDEEMKRRGLASSGGAAGHKARYQAPVVAEESAEDEEIDEAQFDEPRSDGEEPEWLDEGAEVYSLAVLPGQAPAPDAENARDLLVAAGIPCYLELSEIPEEKSSYARAKHRLRLLVPGKLNLQATSILERDVFNPDFEAEWKNHLEMLSDEEVHAMHPQDTFCGLFDKVERVTRVYDEELARRGLKP